MFILNYMSGGVKKTHLWTNKLTDNFLLPTIESLKLTKEDFTIDGKIGILASKPSNLNLIYDFYEKYKQINNKFTSNGFILRDNEIEIFFLSEALPITVENPYLYRPEYLITFMDFYNNYFKDNEAPILAIPIGPALEDGMVDLSNIITEAGTEIYPNLELLKKYFIIKIKIPLLRISKFPDESFAGNFSDDELSIIEGLGDVAILKEMADYYEKTPPLFA